MGPGPEEDEGIPSLGSSAHPDKCTEPEAETGFQGALGPKRGHRSRFYPTELKAQGVVDSFMILDSGLVSSWQGSY